MEKERKRASERKVKLTVRYPESVMDLMRRFAERNPELSLNDIAVIAVRKMLGSTKE